MRLAAVTLVFSLALLLSSCCSSVLCNPFPQEDVDVKETTTARSRTTTSTTSATSSTTTTTKPDDNPIGGFLQGLFGFVGEVFGTVRKIAEDPGASKTVRTILQVGANATKAVLNAGGELLRTAPEAKRGGQDVVGGIIRTANETGPFVRKRLNELGQMSKLVGSFVQTFSETMLDSLNDFLKTYDRRLKCNSKCMATKDDAEKAKCEKENCEGFIADEFKFRDDKEKADTGIKINLDIPTIVKR